MPDLHGWITRQIDHRENLANRAAHYGRPDWPQPATAVVDLGEDWPLTTEAGPIAEHISDNDPASVLRRCTADRKILEHHAPAGGNYEPHSCLGCGDDSEYGALVDHTNDCPTLQALAEGYGLTEEQRVLLDRPEPERPVYSGESGSVIGDSIARLYADLYKGLLASTFTAAEAERLVVGDGTGAPLGFFAMTDVPEPSPGERAFAILEPHLADVPLYRPKFASGGFLPKGFGATADAPLCRSDCRWPAVR